MVWSVQLSGDQSFLEKLCKSLPSEVGLITKVDGPAFMLSLPEFEELDDANAIKKAAQKLLVHVAGAYSASGVLPRVVETAHVWKQNKDGTKTVFVLFEEFVNVIDEYDVFVTAEPGKEFNIDSGCDVTKILRLSKTDAAVRQVLELIVRGTDWVNLYRLFEVIQANAKKKQLEEWIKPKKIKLFKQTACSPDALGHEARHGKSVGVPPGNPMSHSEAQSLIQTLVYKWLSTKTSH